MYANNLAQDDFEFRGQVLKTRRLFSEIHESVQRLQKRGCWFTT